MPRLLLFLLFVVPATNSLADDCRRGFDVPDPIITSSSADSAVYGDFDEDGRVDIAYGSFYGIRRVVLNRGNGVFAPLPADAGNGGLSRLVLAAAADVNRDGHLDLIYILDSAFGVAFGDGHGAFASLVISPAGPPTQQKWMFDVNHDGIPDFIDPLDNDRFRVALGTSDGKFTAGPTIVLYNGPSVAYGKMIAGDFDGDGFVDVAHVDGGFTGNQFEIVYAWGTADPAKFITKIVLAGNVDLSTPLVADVDGDGAADIVSGHRDVLHMVRSIKRVTTSSILALPGMTAISNLSRHDLNGDGRADLVFGRNDATVGVALGTGNGGFSSAVYAALPGATGFAIVDIYGDGAPAIVATGGPQGLRVIPGSAFTSDLVGASRVFPVDDLGRTNRTQVYDVDGDGHDDVIMSDIDSPQVAVLFGDGSDRFHPAAAKRYANANSQITNGPVTALAGDFDGNGSADLALSSGYPQFLPSTIEFDNHEGVFGPASMTVDVDVFFGLLHVGTKVPPALLARHGSDLGILRISSARSAQFTRIAQATESTSLTIVDTDGDGVDEVVIAGGDVLRILKGPDAPWREVATISCFGCAPRKIVAADLNADGRMDLVATLENNYMVALQQADGSYATTFYQGWGSVAGVAVTDFDHDGVPDLVVATYKGFGDPGYLQIVRGTGNGKFEPYATALINEPFGAPVLIDVDRDGWDDVLIGSQAGIQIVRNVCVTPRVRATAVRANLAAGQQATLVVHVLSTDAFAVGLLTIREGGKVLLAVQPFDTATTTWSTPPLTAGVHTYDIEYSDQFAGSSHSTISVTASGSSPRRRAVR